MCIYIYIIKAEYTDGGASGGLLKEVVVAVLETSIIHPVSITRFPLTRFSRGSGLLRNPLFHR